MNMRQSNAVLFAKSEFRSHCDFPLIGSFDQRGKSPLIVIEKFQSKDYIYDVIESDQSQADRKVSVAEATTDTYSESARPPLSAVPIIGNERSDRNAS